MSAILQHFQPVALWLLEAGAYAAVLAILVGAILHVCGRWLSPRARYALWLLVAVRLCVPSLPILPFSYHALLPGPQPGTVAGQLTVVARGPTGTPSPHAEAARPEAPAASSPSPAVVTPDWSSWAILVWLLGVLFLAIRLARAAMAERRRNRLLEPGRDDAILETLALSAARAGVRRAPGLLAGKAVSAPALTGFFRPRILLPERLLDPSAAGELGDVLHHELGHQKRGDVAQEWLLSILEIVHWPNPFCRWAFGRAREERELACDELAVRWSGDCDGSRYAATLVGLAEAASARPALAAVGAPGGKRLERRIRALVEPCPRRTSKTLAGALLVLCAAAGLTCSIGGQDRGAPVSKVYDLGPLAEDRDFVPPRLGETVAMEHETPTPSPVAVGESRRKRSATVAGRLREAVPAELWAEDCRIEAQDGAVVVHAPQAVHEQIAAALKKMLSDREIFVSIQFRLLAVSEAGIDSLPPALRRDARMAAEEMQFKPRPVTFGEMNALLGPANAKVESTPSITCFHEQVSHTLVMTQHAIIADAKRSERQGGPLEPVVRILNTGFVVQVSATVADDRKSVGLDLSAQWGDVKKPIQGFVVEGVPVDTPEMSLRSAQAKLQAPCGAWMLAGGFEGRHWVEPRETLLWLVKAEIPSGK